MTTSTASKQLPDFSAASTPPLTAFAPSTRK